MNIHEYQAKELLSKFSVKTLSGTMISDASLAKTTASKLGGSCWVLKAQIHAGGRGKAGGVKIAKNLNEVEEYARYMLGMKIVTAQTGPQGKIVRKILIEKAVEIEHEYYLGIVLDRANGKIVLLASSEGGVEIEKVAQETPDKIIKVAIEPAVGITPFIGRKLAYGIGLKEEEQIKKATETFKNLFNLYTKLDCTIAEINPLVLTKDGEILALDAKINFDDNALFLHPEIEELRDPDEESAKELEAHSCGLSYVELDGNIGCLVNGAGLAMATMDIIKLHGGNPANFLDVGGGATAEMVKKGCSLILADKKVKAILINIFGGIMRCDVVAEGVVAALKELRPSIPLVVRLEGTNVSLGKKILQDAIPDIVTATNLKEAAEKVVNLIKK